MLTQKEQEIIKRVVSRNPRRILDKEECYALYYNGLFGNKALTWDSYEAVMKSGWKSHVCMRFREGGDRKRVVYNVPLNGLDDEIGKLEILGVPKHKISFNQSMPDEHLNMQGEVMKSHQGLYLRYSTMKKPMNLALQGEDLTSTGLRAKHLLEANLWPSSLSDLEALFELYPNSVVEFSAYSVQVGNIPGRNTVIWEVRNY